MLREDIHGLREITYKGDINLVTEMDMRSERTIVEMLRVAFPDHGVIAEEETKLSNASGYTWIIDHSTAPRIMHMDTPALRCPLRSNMRTKLS
jgi:hypothetical protein